MRWEQAPGTYLTWRLITPDNVVVNWVRFSGLANAYVDHKGRILSNDIEMAKQCAEWWSKKEGTWQESRNDTRTD